MQEMMQLLLELPEIAQPNDAVDGVAVALCYLQPTRLAEMM
jgi:Holliday junction resolvasome RuvABC endonuclease subunit